MLSALMLWATPPDHQWLHALQWAACLCSFTLLLLGAHFAPPRCRLLSMGLTAFVNLRTPCTGWWLLYSAVLLGWTEARPYFPKHKGGRGNAPVKDQVEEWRQQGKSTTEIRALLQKEGYAKARISQLCPLKSEASEPAAPADTASAAEGPQQQTCWRKTRR